MNSINWNIVIAAIATAISAVATFPTESSGLPPKLSAPDPDLEVHLDGVPGSLPPVFCEHCKIVVKPAGKGLCPTCGRFLKLSFAARKKPVNTLRVEKLLAELIADYQPKNTVLRSECSRLAGALERLERTQPGTTEWQRCDDSARKLAVELDEAKKAAEAAANTNAITVIRRVIGEPDGREYEEDAYWQRERAAIAPQENNASTVQQSETSLTCGYGCGTLARCAEIKEKYLGAWRAFHYLDPDEVKRRGDEATKEMYESLRRHGPARY